MNWIQINNNSTFEDILQLSNDKPVLIFKHSTRCSVSFMAKKNLEWQLDQHITSYLLDLLAYRSISNEIAASFSITHQSPQVILVKNGKAIYNASHGKIDPETINQLCSTT